MYFHNVNIGYYVVAAVVGLFIGEFVSWMNKRLPEYKKVFTLDFFKQYKEKCEPNYILMIITSCIYVVLIYNLGIKSSFIENLELIKYLILTPMLLSVVVIDYKLQIIPNRLNLTMFEIGIVFVFIYGLSNVAVSVNMLLGMLAGGGIFLGITLLGGLVYGKEAMGLGDVKFMGALGLYFGLTNIITIALVSFLIGAILSIILLVTKIKKMDEYIPFGPFIVLATFVVMFIPYETLITVLYNIFTLGLYNKNKITSN